MTKPRTSTTPRKRTTPRAKSAAKGGAAKRRSPRSTKAAVAAPEPIRDTIGPIDAGQRRVLVVRSMEMMRNGGRRGSKTQVWNLGDGVLFEAGIRLVSGTESVEAIVGSLEADLKSSKVTARSLRRYLDNLRSTYRDLVYSLTKHLATDSAIDAMGGDLNALSTLMVSKLGAEVLKSMEGAEFGALDTKDKHALLRASEMFVEAARIQADTRLKDAQISKIADQIMAAQAKRAATTPGGKPNAIAGLTREEIIAEIHKAMVGETGVAA